MNVKWISIATLAALATLPGFAQDATGKKLLEKTCTRCHTLVSTYRMTNTRDRWAEIVDDMVSRGAEATDDELETIIDYLAANHGTKVKINKATPEELVRALGISAKSARAIVDFRKQHGVYKALPDLKKVPNLDWKAIEQQKQRLDFGLS